MKGNVLRLVLLVSCAHAMVHIYELAYPSVEQLIAAQLQVGPRMTGALGTCWRLPFGAFAVAAGWLTDRYGAKRTLVTYLFGCSGMAILAACAPGLGWLFVAFFGMGTFASVYHPAGLALISHAVAPEDHPRALSIHGIFGSAGIAMAPLLAAPVLSMGIGWRGYFALMAIPGAVLGCVFIVFLRDHWSPQATIANPKHREDLSKLFHPIQYGLLLAIGTLSGFIYAATMNFMPRYLDQAGLSDVLGIPPEGMRNYLTAGVLGLGILGQYASGRFARAHTLQPYLAGIYLLVAPCLLWMGVAQGATRIVAASMFSIGYFMTQPVFNSLIPRYVPPARRSLGYGLSFMLSFGIGSFGALFAGSVQDRPLMNYGTLAAVAALACILTCGLWYLDHRKERDR